jgi:hypothetical protein
LVVHQFEFALAGHGFTRAVTVEKLGFVPGPALKNAVSYQGIALAMP